MAVKVGVKFMSTPSNTHDSHIRSIAKAFSWRILSTFTTVVIAYFIIGNIDTAIAIGSIEFFLKLLVYYFHERFWQLIPRGILGRIYNFRQDLQ